MDAFHSRGMEPDLFCVCDDPRGAMLWAKEGLATAIFPQSMSSLCQDSASSRSQKATWKRRSP